MQLILTLFFRQYYVGALEFNIFFCLAAHNSVLVQLWKSGNNWLGRIYGTGIHIHKRTIIHFRIKLKSQPNDATHCLWMFRIANGTLSCCWNRRTSTNQQAEAAILLGVWWGCSDNFSENQKMQFFKSISPRSQYFLWRRMILGYKGGTPKEYLLRVMSSSSFTFEKSPLDLQWHFHPSYSSVIVAFHFHDFCPAFIPDMFQGWNMAFMPQRQLKKMEKATYNHCPTICTFGFLSIDIT